MHHVLRKLYPTYFQHFSLPEETQDQKPLEACAAYSSYLNTHTKNHRQEILAAGKSRLLLQLHEQEAAFENDLRWVKKVLGAYDFHRRCADRQNGNLERGIGALQQPQILLWLDWKQNVPSAMSKVFWLVIVKCCQSLWFLTAFDECTQGDASYPTCCYWGFLLGASKG